MSNMILNSDYKDWLFELKENIRKSQIKASLSINKELLLLYFNLGVQILDKQRYSNWGSNFLGQLSKDLQAEFPTITGFSKRNLELIRQWTSFYISENSTITKQVVSQLESSDKAFFSIPWGHHILIIQKIKNTKEAYFYIKKTVESNWSRAVLEYQIETNLFKRQGSAITNFKDVLPETQSDLAQRPLSL